MDNSPKPLIAELRLGSMPKRILFELAVLFIGILLGSSAQSVVAAVQFSINPADSLTAICKQINATPTVTPPPPVTPPVVVPPVVSPPPVVIGASGEVSLKMFTTSWAAFDNTPPGSDIQFDGTHSGGTGTYSNPISLASGYILSNGKPVFDYPIGTMFYLSNLEKYFKVTDECGGDNGQNPANTPCHKSEQPPYPQVDLWAGNVLSSAVTQCEDAVTGVHLMIENPKPTYKVAAGQIYSASGCAKQFGDSVVSN